MSGVKDSENIGKLRDRLYERGNPTEPHKRHELHDEEKEVPTSWRQSKEIRQHDMKRETQPATEKVSVPPTPPPPLRMSNLEAEGGKKKGYRFKLMMLGLIFFAVSLVVSIGLLLFGNNTYSGKNITIDVDGPFTIGGGEVLPVQVAITNGNEISIASATLIVEYFPGTISAGEEKEQLFIERLALDAIGAGETVNIPIRAVVFGEENEEQVIKVSIEYRTENSNARLFKEADPLRYKISSSPVSISTESLKKISSGQATDIVVTVKSNAPTTLSKVLVRAEYPIGFDYDSSTPAPFSGENAWLIENLKPESEEEIVISGVVVGKETDEYAINFTVGIPDDRNKEQIASLFGTAQTQFEIEQPFLNVALTMGNVVNDTKVAEPNQLVNASIEITNTLKDTIYDLIVKVSLGGNAIADLDVGPPRGFYDSRTDTITWDVSNSPELSELRSNESTRVSFAIEPDSKVALTPEVTMDVYVEARRVRESQVAETLTGTAKGAIRVVSEPDIKTSITYDAGPFNDTGSIPPQAEKETTYTANMLISNGSNDLTNAVVTAILPTYVTWKDEVSDGGVTYNSTTRTVTWQIGNLSANKSDSVSFQLGVTPSKTQVGQTPVIIGEQQMRATDRFTNTTIYDSYPARTTEMSLETGYESQNGRVIE